MPLPRRVVLACTSAIAPLHEGHNTGIWINEAQHPFNVFRKAGFEVDLVSETGKWGADWLSLQPDFLNGKDKETYEDKTSEFRSKLDSMLTPDEIDASKVSVKREKARRALYLGYKLIRSYQVWHFLRISGSRRLNRLSRRKRPAKDCYSDLDSRRYGLLRMPRPSNFSWCYRSRYRQIRRSRQDVYGLWYGRRGSYGALGYT